MQLRLVRYGIGVSGIDQISSEKWSRYIEMNNKSIGQLLRAIRSLPEDQPVHNPRKWYLTQHEHWIGWLSEYNGPGAYNRKTRSGRDARFAYNHVVQPEMLVYLAAATRMDPTLVVRAKRVIRGTGTLMLKAGAIRRLFPWESVAVALWPIKKSEKAKIPMTQFAGTGVD